MYTDGCVHIKVKSDHSAFCEIWILINTVREQNNGNTKKVRNRICFDYIKRTPLGKTECSSIF
jgi:hypothetical protein